MAIRQPTAPVAYIERPDLAAIAVPAERPGFEPGKVLRLLFAPALPTVTPRPLLPGTEPFAERWQVEWHVSPAKPPRDAACYFATDAVISGLGQIWLDGELVTTEELLPRYVYRLNLGLPERAAEQLAAHSRPLRTIERPCVAMVGGMNVYGHVLIETMFHMLMAQRLLKDSGVDAAFLIPETAGLWFRHMLEQDFGVPTANVEFYRPAEERIHLRQAILPAMLHLEDGFHPVANDLVADMLDRLDPLPPPPVPAPRLFLSRGDFNSQGRSLGRLCANEAELIRIAETRFGFTAVRMEKLPWREQIALLRNARIVAGQFGSAMHGTLFCDPGTRVVSLGILNLTQSEIAALRGQDMAYMTRDISLQGEFTIDEDAFSQFLEAVVG